MGSQGTNSADAAEEVTALNSNRSGRVHFGAGGGVGLSDYPLKRAALRQKTCRYQRRSITGSVRIL